MGELVRSRLDRALRAVYDRDEALACTLINSDREVNDRYLDLESECISLLALQQPVADDLRIVAASFKILTDLERIGDHAVNIAARTLYMVESDLALI